MSASAAEILRNCPLSSDGQLYRLLRLPAQLGPAAASILAGHGNSFGTVICDEYETTLLLPEEVYAGSASQLPGAECSPIPYRLITFNLPLPPDLVGFLAQICAVLAQAGIPLLAYGAFSRDHIFVPAQQFDSAMAALQSLQAQS